MEVTELIVPFKGEVLKAKRPECCFVELQQDGRVLLTVLEQPCKVGHEIVLDLEEDNEVILFSPFCNVLHINSPAITVEDAFEESHQLIIESALEGSLSFDQDFGKQMRFPEVLRSYLPIFLFILLVFLVDLVKETLYDVKSPIDVLRLGEEIPD